MIHFSNYKPKMIPYLGDLDAKSLARVQSLESSPALNREKIEELGRDGAVGYKKGTPSVSVRMTQFEHGNIEIFRLLANKPDSTTSLTLADFRESMVDLNAFLIRDNGAFLGTLWYPKLRINGFSWSIGDPQAKIERSFDLVGEGAIILQNNNAYLIYKRHTVDSSEVPNVDIVVDDPAPVQNPDTGNYIERVVLVRGSETRELEEGTDYTYNSGTQTLTVNGVQENDVVKYYYTASSYISGQDLFELNDTDPAVLSADSVSIYLITGSYLHRIQSITIDVAFEREDQMEIGSKEVVLRGIKNQTVTVTLGRLLETWSIEEALRGVASGYGVIDVQQFIDNAGIVVKFYDSALKQNFRYGLKITGLSPTELRQSASVGNYTGADTTMEGSSLLITTNEADLGV